MGLTTWQLVFEWFGHKVPLKWVFLYKINPDTGEIDEFKARLVVRGDLQLPTDFNTYAATLHYKVFRATTVYGWLKGMKVRQWDIVNAFPNATIPHQVHCAIPEGFERILGLNVNALAPGTALLLNKALYGLSESPRLWYDLFVVKMEAYGFELVPLPGVQCLITH